MILRLTGYLNKKKNSGFRIISGSFFASLIVFVTVFSPNSLLLYPISKIIFSILIVVIAFKHRSWFDLFKTWLLFYFVSFSIGGIILGLHFIFQRSIYFDYGGVMTVSTGLGTPISWLFVIVGFPFCWLFTKQTMDKQTLVNYKSNQLYKCQIQLFDQSVSLEGYLDSANHLVDPISNKPVIIIDDHIIDQLFNDEWITKLKHLSLSLDLGELDSSFAQLIRLIPYQDVTNPAGILIAIKPDLFTLINKEEILQSQDVLVGLRFSELASDQMYHCLLNPQIFKYLR